MSLDIILYTDVDLGGDAPERITLSSANITHNLKEMANHAGIGDVLWYSEDHVKYAGELVMFLRDAIADMESRPLYYKQFNSPNGWGTYDNFLPWLRKLLEACIKYPKANVHSDR